MSSLDEWCDLCGERRGAHYAASCPTTSCQTGGFFVNSGLYYGLDPKPIKVNYDEWCALCSKRRGVHLVHGDLHSCPPFNFGEKGHFTSSGLFSGKDARPINSASIVNTAIVTNDYVCPTCKNDRCSKSEKTCWKCGNNLLCKSG